MARFLGIDWDYDRMHVVAVNVARGKVHIEKACVLEIPHTQDEAACEAIGNRFKELLKEKKIAPAPILACIGRERVVFKEIRYPAVEPGQEPALVRFQATKELTEAPDRMVIDYAPFSTPANGEDRLAILSIARKTWLRSLDKMCTAAGLKLLALTPRPFGTAGCLQYITDSSLAQATAVLTLSTRWAEFAVVRDGQLLFARPLPLGENLLGEVRRNLALYSSQLQSHASPDAVKALFVAGDDEHSVVIEQLRDVLAIPVQLLDPFAKQEHVIVSGDRGGFTGVVGLTHLWAKESTPINLAAPKEPKVEKSTAPRRYLLAAGALVPILLLGFLGSRILLDQQVAARDRLRSEIAGLDRQIKMMTPDLNKVKKIAEWEESDLSIIDELFDLKARFPVAVGFRATRVQIKSKAAKSGNGMQMTITGDVPQSKQHLIYDLESAINQDPNCFAKATLTKGGDEKSRSGEPLQKFTIDVDIRRRDLNRYVEQLEPARPGQRPGAGGDFTKKKGRGRKGN